MRSALGRLWLQGYGFTQKQDGKAITNGKGAKPVLTNQRSLQISIDGSHPHSCEGGVIGERQWLSSFGASELSDQFGGERCHVRNQ